MVLHVMHYNDIAVDYMVGAQLDGFDTMVHLTDENDFIVLEAMSICLTDRQKAKISFVSTIALISELHGIILMSFLRIRTMWNSLKFFLN
jgi:UDP-N-acetylmuramate: L-alanyl-gamma-D-glutamyl-meso-diaminopimelate ligase